MLMQSRVRLARVGRGIAAGERHIVKAVQDEASPAASRRKTPEAQELLLAEREGVLFLYGPGVSYHSYCGSMTEVTPIVDPETQGLNF